MEVVTGATGCIGNVLTRELLRKGKKVRVLIRSTSDISSLEGLEIEKVLGDILDKDSLIKAFKGADIVYHLAAIISIMPGDRALIRRVNLEGTRNVIDACLKCGVRRLVYTSSIHALEEPPLGTVIDEDMPFDINSNRGEYDRSKALASLEVIEVARDGLDSVVVCPTGVVGPYDFRGSLITRTFIDFARKGIKMNVDGAYDFVDVRDVAAGHILAAEKGKTGHYYILSGQRITLDEIFSILEEITGVKAPKYKVPFWLAKTAGIFTPLYYKLANKTPRFTNYSINTLRSNSYISHEKAGRELGYEARPIKKSIEDTFEWLHENKML
ncbi:MAG TPA: SDR family oxidoreductase [Candidatus Hydromicrobium sp.]